MPLSNLNSAWVDARPVAPSRLADVLPPGASAVLTVGAGGCRWPLGEVHEDAFRFCGVPRVRRSCCAVHARLSRLRCTK